MIEYLTDLNLTVGRILIVLAPVFYIITVANIIGAWSSRREAVKLFGESRQMFEDAGNKYVEATLERQLMLASIEKYDRSMKEFAGLWQLGMHDDAIEVLVDAGHDVNDQRPRKQHE